MPNAVIVVIPMKVRMMELSPVFGKLVCQNKLFVYLGKGSIPRRLRRFNLHSPSNEECR